MVLAKAGHTVYATMRNLERGAALRNAAEQEQLPIWIMDVNSDPVRGGGNVGHSSTGRMYRRAGEQRGYRALRFDRRIEV